jgi:hypothetical protein
VSWMSSRSATALAARALHGMRVFHQPTAVGSRRRYDASKIRKDRRGTWNAYAPDGTTVPGSTGWDDEQMACRQRRGEHRWNPQPLQWKNKRTKADRPDGSADCCAVGARR